MSFIKAKDIIFELSSVDVSYNRESSDTNHEFWTIYYMGMRLINSFRIIMDALINGPNPKMEKRLCIRYTKVIKTLLIH